MAREDSDRDYERLPWENAPEEDDAMTYEICGSCLVAGIRRKCKVICPTCGAILMNCQGD